MLHKFGIRFGSASCLLSILHSVADTPQCLEDAIPASQRRFRISHGRNITIGRSGPWWASQEVIARVMHILVQEALGVHMDVYIERTLGLEWMDALVAGCWDAHLLQCDKYKGHDPPCHLIPEFWRRSEGKKPLLFKEATAHDPEAFARVNLVSALGYTGVFALFVWRFAVDEAYASTGRAIYFLGELLKNDMTRLNLYTSYNAMNFSYGMYQWCANDYYYHSSHAALVESGYTCHPDLTNNNPYRDAEGGWPTKPYPLLNCSQWIGVLEQVRKEYLEHGFVCRDGFWLSATCASISPGDEWKDDCVVVANYALEHIVLQPELVSSMQAVVVPMGWAAYLEYFHDTATGADARDGKRNIMIFEWWTPDGTIQELFSKGSSMDMRTTQISVREGLYPKSYTLTTVMHEDVYKISPEVAYLVQSFHMTTEDMVLIQDRYPTYINATVDADMAKDMVACEWVRARKSIWKSWVGVESCRANTYFDQELNYCVNCPLGLSSRRQLVGLGSCLPCPAGQVFEVALETCMPCAIGSYANHSESLVTCTLCPLGRYVGSVGASSCEACPEFSTTSAIASRHKQDCVCDVNAFSSGTLQCVACPPGRAKLRIGDSNVSACLCSEGTFLRSGDLYCSSCPAGMDCPFGSDDVGRYPLPLYGYWTDSARPMDVFRCVPAGWCVGGAANACAEYHDVKQVSCGRCVEGAFMDGSEKCLSCGGKHNLSLLIILIIVIALTFLALTAFIVSRDVLKQQNKAVAILTIAALTFTTVQSLTLFHTLNVEYPEPLLSVVKILQFVSFDLRVISMGCIVGPNPVLGHLQRQLVAPVAIVIIGVFLFVKAIIRGKEFHFLSELVNLVGSIMTIFFISVVVAALAPFVVFVHPGHSGVSVLSLPSVLQGSTDWTLIVSMSVLSLCFTAFPFVALISYIAVLYPSCVSRGDASSLRMFRFHIFRYRPQAYFYGNVLITRNLCMCLVPVVVCDDSVSQLILMSSIILGFLVVTLLLQPWKHQLCNRFDGWSTSCLQMVLVVAACFTTMKAQQVALEVVSSILVAFMIASVLGVGTYAVRLYLRPHPYYHYFMCHHKGGAGAQSRLFKILFFEISRQTVFIDSDDLVDLDGLFDTVKSNVGHVIVFLTKSTLTRPWCAGEIVTAFRNNVKTTKLRGHDFEAPLEIDPDSLACYIDGRGVVLAKYIIELKDVSAAYRWLLSDSLGCVNINMDLSGQHRFLLAANDLLGKTSTACGEELPKFNIDSCTDGIVVSCDGDDMEATACAAVILKFIETPYLTEFDGSVHLVADYPIEYASAVRVVAWISRARGCLVVLSANSLTSVPQLKFITLCMARVRSSSVALTVVPVATPTCIFPLTQFYENVASFMSGKDICVSVEYLVELMRSFFHSIAVTFASHAALSTLEDQCRQILSRVIHRVSCRPQRSSPIASPNLAILRESATMSV